MPFANDNATQGSAHERTTECRLQPGCSPTAKLKVVNRDASGLIGKS
jgi:hypothetical protein